MQVLVLGAGVIGVSTAYYLAEQGHSVTVLDRQPGAGLETSYVNAGEITVGYAAPWSGPGLPLKALKWAFSADSPIRCHPRLDPAMAAWMWQWWRNCTASRYAINKRRMVGLAAYSLECLQALRNETGIHYDERSLGILQLFRTDAQFAAAEKDLAILRKSGIAHSLLDAAACLELEPGLRASRERIAGGIRLPADETGDCFKFTQRLAERAQRAGVDFRFGVDIQRLLHKYGHITGVETAQGVLSADAFVTALGSYSTGLLRPLGIRMPVYPLKGYSITAPIIDTGRAPRSSAKPNLFGRSGACCRAL